MTSSRIILRVPALQFQQNRDEPIINYAVGHKYLVTLDRLNYRETQKFLEHLIEKFNLPARLKTEAVLVKEDQDRLVIELA